jgi:molybdopterin synthase sulfur carrier subunit
MAKVIIPTPLRKFTDNKASVETNSNSVLAAINGLANEFPELKEHLFDEKDIRELNNENTAVDAESIVSIIPAIAGGIQFHTKTSER